MMKWSVGAASRCNGTNLPAVEIERVGLGPWTMLTDSDDDD